MNALTINTTADRAMAPAKNRIAGRGYTMLSASKVQGSELMGWPAARTSRTASGLTRSVWSATPDSRRLFTAAQRERIIARDGGCCAYCARKLDATEAH